jgi:hypothetical protein
MEKKKIEIRASVDSDIKRRFEAAYKFKNISFNDAIERAMALFTEKNITVPSDKKRGAL